MLKVQIIRDLYKFCRLTLHIHFLVICSNLIKRELLIKFSIIIIKLNISCNNSRDGIKLGKLLTSSHKQISMSKMKTGQITTRQTRWLGVGCLLSYLCCTLKIKRRDQRCERISKVMIISFNLTCRILKIINRILKRNFIIPKRTMIYSH